MHTIIHKASSRGHANYGWLNTHYTFSFAQYYDEQRIHFGMLRVLNDDIIAAGTGFGSHPHDNMEIVTIPLQGSLEHKDNTGNQKVIQPNEVQIMSAGTGVIHSEYNHSKVEHVALLQIWVFPKKKNVMPRYDQKYFPFEQRKNAFQTLISPNRSADTLWLHQDVYFSRGDFSEEQSVEYTMQHTGNGAYLFIIEGSIEIDGVRYDKRDGIGISETEKFSFRSITQSDLLVIDVPMH